MSFHVGDTVQLHTGQTDGRNTSARIISLTELFGQQYADVFIEPDGPVRRVLASELRPVATPAAALTGGQMVPASLFIARIAAYQLQAMLTQQGVLSAANFRVTPLPHQVLAVDFGLAQFRPRAMIADEVGLGNTSQSRVRCVAESGMAW